MHPHQVPRDQRTNLSSHMVLEIVFSTLTQCSHITNHDYISGLVASYWMRWLMSYCLLVLILVPICQRLHNKSPLIKIVTIICLALLGVLLIVHLSLATRDLVGELDSGYGTQYKYLIHRIRIATAYFAIELIAMILAAGLILSAMSRAAHLRAKVYCFVYPVKNCLLISLLIAHRHLSGRSRSVRPRPRGHRPGNSPPEQLLPALVFHGLRH